MYRDALAVRGDRPFVLTNCFTGRGIDEIVDRIAPVIERFVAAPVVS